MRHPQHIVLEPHRVRAPRLVVERGQVRARSQGIPGLVEANVAVRADAEQLKIESAGLGNCTFVALTLRLRIARLAVQKSHMVRSQFQRIEQVAFEKAAKAPGIATPEADELIDLERSHLRPL